MSYLGTNKIGKMYLGDTEIAKAYLGDDLVFQNTQPALVPYIRGGADGSYIDTGITPDNTTRVIVWARNFNPNAGFLFGSRIAFQNTAFAVNANTGTQSGRISANYGNVISNVGSGDHFTLLSGYHKYELNGANLVVDDTLILTSTGTFSSNSLNIHLFGLNNNGTHTSSSIPIDVCACQIYKGGVLVRDYTVRNTPSVGLYDSVSETLFTNAGAGSLTYGEFNPNAYVPLEYITASASSYFMSEAIGGYSLSAVTKFKPTGTTASYFAIFGGRDATNRCQFFVGNEAHSTSRLSAILGTGSATDFYSSNTDGYVRNKEIVAVKTNGDIIAYIANAKVGNTYSSSVSSSYTTGVPLCVCGDWYAHSSTYTHGFYGNLYYIRLGGYNFVPAKVGGVAGMYDTYNDVFKPSESGTPFVAGPTLN